MSDDKIATIGALRVAKTNDCRDWGLEDMLLDALKRVREDGLQKGMAVLVIRHPVDEVKKSAEREYFAAGGTSIELAGLMALANHDFFLHNGEDTV